MNAALQRFLMWAGLVCAGLYFLGFVILMGFFPPPSPSLPAAEVVAHYTRDIVQFRIGVVVMIISGGFFLPWSAVISAQIARLDKGVSVGAILQGLAGACGAVLFFLPPIFWGVAAFSPERDAAITLVFHEYAFLTFITAASAFPFQCLPIILAAFTQKEEGITAFPRWMGYFTAWMIITVELGVAAMLFKSGPFAWNGIFPFYIPLASFTAWAFALVFTQNRAIRYQASRQ